MVLLLFGVIYLVSYIQRIKHVFDFGDHTVLNMFVNAMVLVGTSLLAIHYWIHFCEGEDLFKTI